MDEIGYENCDYISLEVGWQAWAQRFEGWPFPVELHVPCREPLSHLMSRCNYRHHKFICSMDNDKLLNQIQQCGLGVRFHSNLVGQFPGSKCFDYDAIDEYVEFMASKLRERRWQADYVPRKTNQDRNKSAECIWDKAHAEVRAKVEMLLRTRPEGHLIAFCAACMGSENELPLKGIIGR